MKVASLVLLLSVLALTTAYEIGRGMMKRNHKWYPTVTDEDNADCGTGDDCDQICNWQCFDSTAGMCVDGSCYCHMGGGAKKR